MIITAATSPRCSYTSLLHPPRFAFVGEPQLIASGDSIRAFYKAQ